MTLEELSDSETCAMPLDQLAFLVLDHLKATNEWNIQNFYVSEAVRRRSVEAQQCLTEAMNWLLYTGLIARGKPGQSSTSDAMFISRVGKEALDKGLRVVRAGEAPRVRSDT